MINSDHIRVYDVISGLRTIETELYCCVVFRKTKCKYNSLLCRYSEKMNSATISNLSNKEPTQINNSDLKNGKIPGKRDVI